MGTPYILIVTSVNDNEIETKKLSRHMLVLLGILGDGLEIHYHILPDTVEDNSEEMGNILSMHET